MQIKASTLEERFGPKIAPGNSEEFYRILAESEERLLHNGKWNWTREKLSLSVIGNQVVLPAKYDSIVAARINGVGMSVMWQEAEYLEGGRGEIDVDGGTVEIIDIGLVQNDEDELERVYKITGQNIETIEVLAKLAARDELTEDDTMYCNSATALKQAMFSVIYEEQNDLQKSVEYMRLAISTLDGGESSYRGVAKTIFKPTLFGSSRFGRTNFK